MLSYVRLGLTEWEMTIDFPVAHQEEADDDKDPVDVI